MVRVSVTVRRRLGPGMRQMGFRVKLEVMEKIYVMVTIIRGVRLR